MSTRLRWSRDAADHALVAAAGLFSTVATGASFTRRLNTDNRQVMVLITSGLAGLLSNGLVKERYTVSYLRQVPGMTYCDVMPCSVTYEPFEDAEVPASRSISPPLAEVRQGPKLASSRTISRSVPLSADRPSHGRAHTLQANAAASSGKKSRERTPATGAKRGPGRQGRPK